MRAITSFIFILIFLFIGLPLLGKVFLIFLPDSEIDQLFSFIPNLIWQMMKQFFLEDKIKSFAIYIVVFLVLNGLGIYISKKRENYIYEVIGFALSLVAIANGSIL